MAFLTSVSHRAAGQLPDGDRRALAEIFAEQHIIESVLSVHQRAAAMAVGERYAFLAGWVLPGPDHETFRLALDFSPTHPPPVRVEDAAGLSPEIVDPATDVPAGGELVSPALDLVDTAAEAGRLEELRARIERSEAVGEVQQRCRLVLLGLTELAAGDSARAAEHFEEVFGRVAERTYESAADRWPETLAVHACVRNAATREAGRDALYRMLQNQVRHGVMNGPPAWDRWVTATAGQVFAISLPEALRAAGKRKDLALRTWSPVSRTTGWSRGLGMPSAVWRASPGLVENRVSHDDDYLFFHAPLRGDFEVECEVTSFGWRDMHLLVAGTYVAPIYDHVSYGVGAFGTARPPGVIEPRLSECGDWIRYRAVVRAGKCSTYVNGRLIHVESLPAGHDPWLAIRTPSYTNGTVRDVRITGSPTIPRQFCLSSSPTLTGWSAYHGEPIDGENAYWRQEGDPATGGEIVGQQETWLAGQGVERLLQYGRPMLEDGTIEYEFFYAPGQAEVHPALDRRALILRPDRVRIHWITDGVFNRSDLSPLNLTDDPEDRRGPSRLPLVENGWNRVRLELAGETFRLILNDQLVYETELEPHRQQTFGLFHWADQTQARVRNVVWTGAWPRQLPPVEEQELAGEGTRFLDERIPELTARFQHDFAQDGVPQELFRVRGPAVSQTILPGRGVRLARQGTGSFAACWITPLLRVHGDFDVAARFEAWEARVPDDGACGVWLSVILEDPLTTHLNIFRGTLREPGTRDRQIVQAEFTRVRPTRQELVWTGTTAEEAKAGTLRLARRGDRLYCLFAEEDSPNFRLIHTETIPTDQTLLEGVRLRTSTHAEGEGRGESSVIWKRITIHAEKISDLPGAAKFDKGD